MSSPLDQFSPSLREEIEYQFDLWCQGDDAPAGYTDLVLYCILNDIDDHEGCERSWRTQIRRWMIAKGVYVEVTQADLDRQLVFRGGRTSVGKPDFRLGGKMYQFHKHVEGYYDSYE